MSDSDRCECESCESARRVDVSRLGGGMRLAELCCLHESAALRVSPDELLGGVLERLDRAPDCPGACVMDGVLLEGVLTSEFVHTSLSRAFGRELFLQRPIEKFLEACPRPWLSLPEATTLSEAIEAAIARPSERRYDPIVLVRGDETVGLVSFRQLLQAQVVALETVTTELVVQRDTAWRAEQSKASFLANMSHELRTPLTAILGFAEMMSEPDCDPGEIREGMSTILRNGQHLLGLINDVLDVSKLEAGRLEIVPAPTRVGSVVEDVASMLSGRARQKGVALDVDLGDAGDVTISVDPLRMRQILINLVGNAIKFTHEGRVVVRVSAATPPGEDVSLRVEIEDSGIGMTPDQLHQVFDEFVQADVSTSREYGGTGLGLSIARRLARAMGGDIIARSTQGSGSTFTLAMHCEPGRGAQADDGANEEAASQIEGAKRDLRGARVLVAEDGPDNRRLIHHLLDRAGATVVMAETGAAAVDAVIRADKLGGFDLILMDMQMPVMDGYRATRTLRSRAHRGPIIALTAHAAHADRERCFEAGCDEYLTKPIDRERFYRVCSKYRRRGDRPGARAA